MECVQGFVVSAIAARTKMLTPSCLTMHVRFVCKLRPIFVYAEISWKYHQGGVLNSAHNTRTSCEVLVQLGGVVCYRAFPKHRRPQFCFFKAQWVDALRACGWIRVGWVLRVRVQRANAQSQALKDHQCAWKPRASAARASRHRSDVLGALAVKSKAKSFKAPLHVIVRLQIHMSATALAWQSPRYDDAPQRRRGNVPQEPALVPCWNVLCDF
mmetsp:Transcript_110226/g.310933  ORF Transcript_110226/g.310933 Transcript_110226/m.310933 type:complete len:213 (+) Transcript_110226:2291-2929(+)